MIIMQLIEWNMDDESQLANMFLQVTVVQRFTRLISSTLWLIAIVNVIVLDGLAGIVDFSVSVLLL